ncbi:hypothetical protein MSAN_00051100 [Mycena sanguinolenta]|uniref:TPR-like protein n=1 Tax=Mycena sanguinolenta TaxID=230812 RepID=A0A8H6ZHF1_9AGAR|nr:hypothetical protein MSAN_00051100 [Mycena sanguinolenta]
MALPMLVNNADCGPSNGLQGLSKRFDQDRGLQQDHFGSASRAGSSRETFRSQTATPNGGAAHLEDAARFFSGQPAAPQFASGAFDLSALHGSLPPVQMQMQGAFQQAAQTPPAAAWAADFMLHSQPSGLQKGGSSNVHAQMEREMNAAAAPAGVSTAQQQPRWNPSPMFSPMQPMQNYGPAMGMGMMQLQQPHQAPATQHDQVLWDREFETLLAATSAPATELRETQATSQITDAAQVAQDADELARTAGLLLETVRDAQATNEKFQNSTFLGLMRGLRDREVVVEGNEVVQNTGQQAAQADVKGKGRAVDGGVLGNGITGVPSVGRSGAQNELLHSFVTDMLTNEDYAKFRQERQRQGDGMVEEDPNDEYFRQENAEYQHYWNSQARASTSQAQLNATNAQSNEWGHLQADWDAFEATSTGIKPVVTYEFQRNNPYLSDTPSFTTRHHLAHGGRQPMLDSVLELEAVVQRNMTDASAWFDLGVKQQANEREKQALQALTRAVELDPSFLAAWLALAISHTNDGNRAGTHNAVRQWVDRNERYQGAVAQYRAAHPEADSAPMAERFANLIQCLIEMARSAQGDTIDADIQIALAVLLNTNEDYAKAQDCFRTALAVRPDDWLLYNRVGATMANSGRAEEALQYYYRALELNPMYIRARFNLGISCINLRRFEEAAQHILDALGLQESDGVSYGGDSNTSGVTTTALWDSLRTACMHMQRPDLSTFCDRQDLEGFRKSFIE